jgi:hypothetical protein
VTRVRGGVRHPLSALAQLVDRDAARADVVFLGDSVVGRVADEDVDRRPLGQMVADALLPTTCAWSWFAAYHLEMFDAQVRAVVRAGWRPATIVVPINLRGFSKQWWGNPPWTYEDHRRAMRRFHGRPPLLRPHTSTAREIAAHRARPLGSPLLPGWTVGDAEDARDNTEKGNEERWRVLFAMHLGVPLPPSHPRLAALRDMQQVCAANGVVLHAYVTPINVIGAHRHLGDDLVDIIRANVRTVIATGTVADHSEALGPASFFYEDDPTEHLNERGRLALTDLIVSGVEGARRRRR